MVTAGANIASTIMAMEAATTDGPVIMPSTGIMLTATMIVTLGNTTKVTPEVSIMKDTLAGNTTKGIPVVSTMTRHTMTRTPVNQ